MVGEWKNEGQCNGKGSSTCGEGDQVQVRQCTDGTVEKCTDEDKRKIVTCNAAGTALPDCPKVLGIDWQNEGPCNGIGNDPTCGEGIQLQTRHCDDGTKDKCTDEEKQRTISCEDAGTALPDCRKF